MTVSDYHLLRDSPALPIKGATAEEPTFWGGKAGAWTAIRSIEGVVYTPVTDGWAVGYRVSFPDGRPDDYVYLNPAGEMDDGGAQGVIFLYQGPDGDPSADDALIHCEVGPRTPSSTT